MRKMKSVSSFGRIISTYNKRYFTLDIKRLRFHYRHEKTSPIASSSDIPFETITRIYVDNQLQMLDDDKIWKHGFVILTKKRSYRLITFSQQAMEKFLVGFSQIIDSETKRPLFDWKGYKESETVPNDQAVHISNPLQHLQKDEENLHNEKTESSPTNSKPQNVREKTLRQTHEQDTAPMIETKQDEAEIEKKAHMTSHKDQRQDQVEYERRPIEKVEKKEKKERTDSASSRQKMHEEHHENVQHQASPFKNEDGRTNDEKRAPKDHHHHHHHEEEGERSQKTANLSEVDQVDVCASKVITNESVQMSHFQEKKNGIQEDVHADKEENFPKKAKVEVLKIETTAKVVQPNKYDGPYSVKAGAVPKRDSWRASEDDTSNKVIANFISPQLNSAKDPGYENSMGGFGLNEVDVSQYKKKESSKVFNFWDGEQEERRNSLEKKNSVPGRRIAVDTFSNKEEVQQKTSSPLNKSREEKQIAHQYPQQNRQEQAPHVKSIYANEQKNTKAPVVDDDDDDWDKDMFPDDGNKPKAVSSGLRSIYKPDPSSFSIPKTLSQPAKSNFSFKEPEPVSNKGPAHNDWDDEL